MVNIFGHVYMSVFIETGTTEKGAKISATRYGSNIVGYRSPINNMFISTAIKNDNGKWTPVNR